MAKQSKDIVKQQQNAAEYYFTYRLQQELEKLGIATTTNLSKFLKSEFDQYILTTGLTTFMGCVYQVNVDNHIATIASKWATKYSGLTIDASNYAKAGRAAQVKGDVKLTLSNGTEVSISLKNYDDKKLGDIQVNSGTWASAILNLLFDSSGLGSWNYNGVKFNAKPKGRAQTANAISQWAMANGANSTALVNVFNGAVSRNDLIKQKYVVSSDTAILTQQVQELFEQDCELYGHAQIDDMLIGLQTVPQSFVKQRFLDIIGFGSEELLCLWTNEHLDSLTNAKVSVMINRLNNSNMAVVFSKKNKNIRLTATDKNGDILTVDIPFTYNKNGAWHDEPTARWCAKSKQTIQPYHRRPAKAKEMNTSTNTWMRLKEAVK